MTSPERFLLQDLITSTGESTGELCTVAERIADGAVFIYPTDTIYGIGGRFDRASVLDTIIAAKERSPGQQMILIAGSIDSFASLGIHFSDIAYELAKRFWPGLLTLVLPSTKYPAGIGIRVSGHPFIMALNTLFSVPLFSTSANITGIPYNPDPDTIFTAVGSRVDFMIDAGILPPSMPSTVVRIGEKEDVTILREGCVPAAEIHRVVNSNPEYRRVRRI